MEKKNRTPPDRTLTAEERHDVEIISAGVDSPSVLVGERQDDGSIEAIVEADSDFWWLVWDHSGLHMSRLVGTAIHVDIPPELPDISR